MLRIVVSAAIAAVLASACEAADGDQRALVDECVRDGTEKAICECVAEVKAEYMDKDLYRADVLTAQGKPDEAQEIAAKVGPDRMMKSVEVAMPHILNCAIDASPPAS